MTSYISSAVESVASGLLNVAGMSEKKDQPDWIIFIASWWSMKKEAGTPFSCSQSVAKRMVSHIPTPDDAISRNYLEVGPGTGVVTELFVQMLGKNDKLYVVEIEQGFYERIREKFKDDPRVIVHLADIATWNPKDSDGNEIKFDAMATGVPLNALPSTAVLKSVLVAYERLVKPNAMITAVEYVGTSSLGQLYKGEEFREAMKMKNGFFAHHASQPAEIEPWNFPVPARVHKLVNNESFFKGK